MTDDLFGCCVHAALFSAGVGSVGNSTARYTYGLFLVPSPVCTRRPLANSSLNFFLFKVLLPSMTGKQSCLKVVSGCIEKYSRMSSVIRSRVFSALNFL